MGNSGSSAVTRVPDPRGPNDAPAYPSPSPDIASSSRSTRRHVRVQQHTHHPQTLGQRRERLIQRIRSGSVPRELPRRALLDVAVQPAHPLPDQVERLGDVGAVEFLGDVLRQPVEVGRQRAVGGHRGHDPVPIAQDHRDRPAGQVPVFVGELGLVPGPDRVDPNRAVAAPGHVAHQVEPQRVGPVQLHDLERVEHVAERLAHLAPVRAEQEAVHEHVLRDRKVGRHQHGGPEHGVELEDVLADYVVSGGPELIGQVLPRTRVPQCRVVIEKRVEPHIEHMGVIPRHGDPPLQPTA